MKIGFIQPGGIGDIVIALPIARHFVDQGHEVIWPIYQGIIEPFRAAAPYVRFEPLAGQGGEWNFPRPLALLKEIGCDRFLPLPSNVNRRPDLVMRQDLAAIMKFDQYKYAVAGVPFREKWNLQIIRNRAREQRLFDAVVREEEFVVCHLHGSNFDANLDVGALAGGKQVIEITEATDNFFDWLLVIERASLRVMIDSCFSNLIDQLQIAGRKIFLVRSSWEFTPVLLGDWTYLDRTAP